MLDTGGGCYKIKEKDRGSYEQEIAAVILCTLLLSALVSLIPSVKAGKEKPIDTLRKM